MVAELNPPAPSLPGWVAARVKAHAPAVSLRDYQEEAIVRVAHAVGLERKRRVVVVLATGGGKAQPVDEPVLTPAGWRPIGSIAAGDYLIGSDGKPTRVTGVYPQGIRPIWRVRFSDGAEVHCDPDHLWAVATKSHRFRNLRHGRGRPFRVLTTRQIWEEGLKDGEGWRHYVPMASAPDLESSDLPIDPYLLGVLLGDGGLSLPGQVRVHTQDDLVETLPLPIGIHARRLTTCGGGASNYQIGGSVGKSPNAVLDGIRALGLDGKRSWEKFIPPAYLSGRSADRLALLQGILDADGSIGGAAGTHADYVTVSPDLARGVCELVRSLGGICRQRDKVTRYGYLGEQRTGRPAYRISIALPANMCPFRYAPKVAAYRARTKYQPTRKIVAIEAAGEAEAVCVSVEADDQLYVTRDYVLTHNTVVFGALANAWLQEDKGRVLILAHRDELITQAVGKVGVWVPRHLIGIVKAKQDEVDRPIVVASVQTLRNPRRLERAGRFSLIVIDECHHAAAQSYRDILDGLGAFEAAGPVVVGVTATPKRGDGAGIDDVFEDIVYRRTYMDLVARGWLVPPRAMAFDIIPHVQKKVGPDDDYDVGWLGKLMLRANAPNKILEAWQKHGEGRPTIVFAPTVGVAQEVARVFNDARIPAAWVSGAMPIKERRAALDLLRTGDVKVVANCAVLTEGFDEPSVACIVVARPTMNESLYIQMVGRGTRCLGLDIKESKSRGKHDCLILDMVGCSDQLTLDAIVELGGREVGATGGGASSEEAPALTGEVPFEVEDGTLVARTVKLHRSVCRWVELPEGWFALSLLADGWVTLSPDDEGTWTVTHHPKRGKPTVEYTNLSVDLGKQVGEGVAKDKGSRGGLPMFGRAGWLDRPITENALLYGLRRGLPITASTTAWEKTVLEAEDEYRTRWAHGR